MFDRLKVKAGYFVGGILNDRPPSTLGEDKYFVIESDEYDSAYFQKFSKFRLYELDKMILTSLEFDHADIYNSVEEIEAEFEAVIPKLDTIIADSTYSSIEKLKNKFKDQNWHLYNNETGPLNISGDKDKTNFQVVLDKEMYSFQTNIIGAHNIYNITSCIILLHLEGFSVSDIQHAVADLSLVKRRQEKRGLYNGAIVIDDFAHHPRAISLTVDAIKTKYPEREIVTIFEPVSATARSNVFQKEFAKSLMSSDEVIIAKSPMATTAKNSNNLDCEKLVDELKGHCKSALVIDNLKDLRNQIKRISNDKNLILVLSNRSCLGLWESDFVKELI
jgi:UDP-N-acetylmuramate: L-alanyl-gamma-D-glutamyl-meso-diaminopimelate ligase